MNSSDASGVQYYETQRAAAGSGSWTTFDSSSTNPLTAAGLNPGTTYDFRQRAVDVFGNLGEYSEVSTTQTQSSGGTVGQVGSYANLNLALHPIYSVDMGQRDYHLFATQATPQQVDNTFGLAGSGSQTHNASGWWDGGAYCRILPPTTDQYERGVFIGNLHRSGSLAVQDFNLRFEVRYGPTLASTLYSNSNGSKYSLVHCTEVLTASPIRNGRPCFFQSPMNTADNASFNRSNTLVTAPSSNTFSAYGATVYEESNTFDNPPGSLTFYANGPQSHYIVDASDGVTSFQGKPIFRCGDFWTIEYRIITGATAQYPRGLIAYRYTNRAGQTVERGIPFNYDTQFALGQFVYEVQQFGCGQWNQALPAGPNTYFDVGGYFTAARNLGGWLGPRTGFLL